MQAATLKLQEENRLLKEKVAHVSVPAPWLSTHRTRRGCPAQHTLGATLGARGRSLSYFMTGSAQVQAHSHAQTRPQVEDLNAKWQRYDASRDEYVRGLHAQLRGLQVPTETERLSASERMKKEIARLNGQLEEKMLACAEAKQELLGARRARDAALERVQVLEQQVWRLGQPGLEGVLWAGPGSVGRGLCAGTWAGFG